jgi:hypothetical protein
MIDLGSFGSIESLTYMFNGLGWFIGAFIFAALWTAYLTVIADINFMFRLIAIPVWLVFTIGLVITIDNFAGIAHPSVPPQSQVISFRIVKPTSHDSAIIEAWMYITSESRTRLYRFPHTQKKENALRQALKDRKRGRRVEVKLRSDSVQFRDGDEMTKGEMLDYDISHRGLPTKDSNEKVEVAPEQLSVQPADDKFMIQIPGGGSVELKRGQTVTVSPNGEIQISTPIVKPPVTTGHPPEHNGRGRGQRRGGE